MATKSEITEIDIKNIQIELSDNLDDIKPYQGFIDCNSPYIGGKLNHIYYNVLPRKQQNKDYLCTKNRTAYYFGIENGVYKVNGHSIGASAPNKIKLEKDSDELNFLNKGNSIFIRNNGHYYDLDIDYKQYNSSFGFIGTTYYATFCKPLCYSEGEWTGSLVQYSLTKDGVHEKKTGSEAGFYVNGVLYKNTKICPYGKYKTYNLIQSDAAGIVVNYSEYNVTDNMTYYYITRNGNRIAENICVESDSVKYWNRGFKKETSDNRFNFLFYANVLSGVSWGNKVYTWDIDKIIACNNTDGIIYSDTKDNWYKMTTVTPEVYFDDDYIYSNTGKIIRFKDDELIDIANDYNDRLIMTNPTGESGMYVTAWHSNAQVQNYPDLATMYPQKINKLGSEWEYPYINDSMPNIEIFMPKTKGGAAEYVKSTSEYNSLLEGTTYPIDDSYNQLYTCSLDMLFQDTYLNEKLAKTDNNSYILAKSQVGIPVFGFNLFSESEMEQIFMVQGQLYGIFDKYIYNISLSDSVISINNVILNKQDLKFLGAFPQYALFWSEFDKSIYMFSGDSTLRLWKNISRIYNIYDIYYDPSRLIMMLFVNMKSSYPEGVYGHEYIEGYINICGTLIIYQDQVFFLSDYNYNFYVYTDKISYDNNVYNLGPTQISFSKKDFFEKNPIELSTAYYGAGNLIKSVNDCIYVKVDITSLQNIDEYARGSLTFWCYVEDGTVTIFTKDVGIVKTEKEKKSYTTSALVRYQPEIQSGLSFSFKIISSLPILNIYIGHQAEALANVPPERNC